MVKSQSVALSREMLIVPLVSRPLFIEEHGLRLLLDREGVGLELSRELYETGEWADTIKEAWTKGREAKARKRREGELGIGLEKRTHEMRETVRKVVQWVASSQSIRSTLYKST